ncbi:MAG TPA: condensation domain-containing protein [Pseudonocardiaceae bacterium]
MVNQVLVPFEGEGAGVEELTWGQIGFWQGMEDTGQSATMGGVTELPPGITVDVVADGLRFSMGRHQALRTRLRFDPAGGRPKQVCSTSGEVPLEIVDIGADDDPAEVAEAVRVRYEELNFDYENEWPVRMAVVRSGDRLTHMVAVYLHLAVDATALDVLVADLLARDPETGAPAGPVTATQPLDQARQQRKPGARRTCDSSLKHLEHVLRTATASRFGEPKYRDASGFRQIRYRSPATAAAIQVIAAREGTNTSSVLLACFGVGLARFTGNSPVMAMLLVSNRFRPSFAESVSPLVQMSPYLIDVADATLSEAVHRAKASVLNTYKNAYYDPYLQDEVIDRVSADRGEEMDFSCFYNDRRAGDRGATDGPLPTAQEIRDALPLSGYEWEYEPDMSTRKLYLNVDDPPGAIDFVMSVDNRYFSAEDAVAVVQGMEAVAAQAAVEPTAPTGVRAPVALTS